MHHYLSKRLPPHICRQHDPHSLRCQSPQAGLRVTRRETDRPSWEQLGRRLFMWDSDGVTP